jgi:hypothetical protein
MDREIPRLRRFTSLTVALDMLVRKRLTLIDYSKWVDVNDRVGMEAYKETRELGFLGAMCLTMAKESFHHWQVFAGDTAGACVFFDPERFTGIFANRPDIICGPVQYVELPRIASVDATDIHRLPFLKRQGFIDEAEFRVIAFSEDEVPVIHVPLDPRAIRKITFSPFVHPELMRSARKVINGLKEWEDLEVRHSRLTDSQAWQRAIAAFPDRHSALQGDPDEESDDETQDVDD